MRDHGVVLLHPPLVIHRHLGLHVTEGVLLVKGRAIEDLLALRALEPGGEGEQLRQGQEGADLEVPEELQEDVINLDENVLRPEGGLLLNN